METKTDWADWAGVSYQTKPTTKKTALWDAGNRPDLVEVSPQRGSALACLRTSRNDGHRGGGTDALPAARRGRLCEWLCGPGQGPTPLPLQAPPRSRSNRPRKLSPAPIIAGSPVPNTRRLHPSGSGAGRPADAAPHGFRAFVACRGIQLDHEQPPERAQRQRGCRASRVAAAAGCGARRVQLTTAPGPPPVPLPQQWHPDRHRGDDCAAAQRRFQEVQEAYEGEQRRRAGAGVWPATRCPERSRGGHGSPARGDAAGREAVHGAIGDGGDSTGPAEGRDCLPSCLPSCLPDAPFPPLCPPALSPDGRSAAARL